MNLNLNRRQLLQAIAAGSAATLPFAARPQGLPETARIFVGFAAGGTVDVTARRTGDKLRDAFAKSIVVENRTGAGGQIAIQALKQMPNDGSVILQTPMSMLGIYPHIYKKLPYDPVADVTPVSLACVFDFGLAVGPLVPASVKTLADFVTWAKANPAQANFGSPAAGSTPHFVGALLGKSAGIDLKHAAYRGTQPAMLDLLGGQIAAVSGPIGDITQHLASGKIRILATSGTKRNRFAPDVPTYAEQGFKELTHSEWFAFFLPPKADAALVARMNAALKAALASKDVIDGLATFGLETMSNSPAELADLLKQDTAKWAPIVKSIGFTADA
jgi:tripartite-type tricarboxylate transporter receptor subunit TctC